MNVAFSKSNKNLVGYKVRRKICIDICMQVSVSSGGAPAYACEYYYN